MKRTYLFTIFFCFFFILANWAYSQTSISGTINQYAAIDSIYPSKDTVEVSNPSFFEENDTVMVYQAKGAKPIVDTTNNPYNFGGVREAGLNEAGKYEIILVKKVDGDKIIFKAILSNDYDINDIVQLIRVPSYKNVSIDGELTCANWDGVTGTGGILALMVSDTIFLNADINVTGKGFQGAVPFESNGECASVDSAIYGSQYFKESRDAISAGFKGEGVAKFDSIYRKGLGRWANGGGGGNARFSGGGGGGNSGNGGYGGEEDTTICITPSYEDNLDYDGFWNALGGSDGFGLGKQFLINDSTIFLGGGGGSGTKMGALSASTGGNGGGIVILIAKVIKSNRNSIIADGASVIDTVSASGAGAGAGGSVVFDINSVYGDVNVSVKGGNGGYVTVDGKSGPGGGGGGGVVLWNSTRPSNVTLDYSGGLAGAAKDKLLDIYSHKALGGNSGTEELNIKTPLTGFLFNSITPDQVICMLETPQILSGSEPRGGNNVFSIQWENSIDGSVWVPIPGAIGRDYQPPALTDTIHYRRIVTSGAITDFGNDIEIIVQDIINQNDISSTDLIECIGNDAELITGNLASFGGNQISYEYIWEYSTDSTIWDNGIGTNTSYNHGSITDTTYIRRRVVSGGCNDTTGLTIVGLPKISNNALSTNQEICEGQKPDEIDGAVPMDGDGSYSIYWEESTDETNWTIVTDSIREDLAPDNLIETTYYRRTVQSDDCFDISDTIKINVLDPISNNFIDTTDLIIETCYNTPPPNINGSVPQNGDGTYTYQWQDSADGVAWSNITANATNEDYQPLALTSTTYFRRIVYSGVNDCCESTTNNIQVNIDPLPIASISSLNDTICSTDDLILDLDITTGQFPYTLIYNDGENDAGPLSGIIEGGLLHTINPETDTKSKLYNYTIVSVIDDNACVATDMTGNVPIVVHGIPVANAGVDTAVCQLTYQLNAIKSFENTSGLWSQISGESTIVFADGEDTLTNVDIPVGIDDEYVFVWKEWNGKCPIDSDTVTVSMYENIYNIEIIRPDTITGEQGVDSIIYGNGDLLIDVKGDYENASFADIVKAYWSTDNSAIQVSDSTIKDPYFTWTENDIVEDFKILWYLDKGACSDTTITLNIEYRDYVFLPTGFTPNGDGVNDKFIIDGLKDTETNTLIIYNRWGTEVFSSDAFTNEQGWDGKNKGKDLPEGTYFYILTRTKANGKVLRDKSFIVIKRF